MKNGLLDKDNGVDRIVEYDASDMAKEYYTDYAKYVLKYRALPSVYDGLKPVQRRIIYTMYQQSRKLMKTAKAAGLAMAYHPHGDGSIIGAMNNMASPLNVFSPFKTKGNFGSVSAGPSAARYTELCLNEVADLNYQFIDYSDMIVGEIGEMEPLSIPCLIPYSTVIGSEGIAIGLSTKIMPLDLIDVIDYYIDYIKNEGTSKKFIKPDVGSIVIDMSKSDISDAVDSYEGKISTYSIVTQISDDSVLIEGLYGKSVDAAMSKIDKSSKWFSSGKVGFRDASDTQMKYIFEIYDKSVTIKDLKEWLEWATYNNTRFRRILEEDGCAIHSNFDYSVKKSLECLNKSIDKKNTSDLKRYSYSLKLYEVLELCKSLGIFKDVSSITTEELVMNIIKASSCDEEIARDIVKKPISYLTRSHLSEMDDLKKKISDIETHDRKKYLISLYKELRKAVLPHYESFKHSVTKDSMLSDPRVTFDSGKIFVTDGKGEEFTSRVYSITKDGRVIVHSIGASTACEIDTLGEEIIGIVTDKYPYLCVYSDFDGYPKNEGRLSVDLSKIWSGKKVINLRDYEVLREVKGFNEDPGYTKSKVSKTDWCKKEKVNED